MTLRSRNINLRLACAALAALLFSAAASPDAARAEQPRDWMVGVQPDGHLLLLDMIFPGMQATYQYNRPVYGMANKLRLRVNSLLTIPFYESQADAEIRLVVLTLGVGAGFRDTFRQQTFRPGESYNLRNRRGTDSRADYDPNLWGFGEVRAELALPFNDHVVFNSRHAFRFEDRPNRSFDYRTGVVHDGNYFLADYWLYFKHYEVGAIAPTFEVLNYDIDKKNKTLLQLGVTATGRPGFMTSDDLLFLQLLFNVYGGRDNGDQPIYGSHMLYGPFTVLLAYRAQLELSKLRWF